jgi:glycosyltransferase involved in cell wall biosynthesis
MEPKAGVFDMGLKHRYSLMMLSLNEIEGLREILPRIPIDILYEVIVVDGGSTDGSIEFAESFGYKVVRQQSKGIVNGIKEGFAALSGDVIIQFTPDNNMIPEKIPELIAKMEEGYDMVVVSRYLPPAKSQDDHLISGFGNWMFTTLVNVLFRTRFTDVLGFYRAYRINLLEELDLEIKLSIDTQLNIRCAKRKKKVAEIPGDEPPRIGGQSSRSIIGNGLIELHTILDEWWHYSR